MDHRRTKTREGSENRRAFLDSEGSPSATRGNPAHVDLFPGRDRHLWLLYLVSDYPEASLGILHIDGHVAGVPSLSRSVGGDLTQRMAFLSNTGTALAHRPSSLR